jgi:hypothetical protein
MENADFWEILPGQDVTWRPLLSLRLRIVGEDATATEEREEGDQEGAGGGVGERDMQELMNKRERKKKSVSFRVLPPSLPASTPGSGRSGQGGEREGAPLGYMKRRGGSGEQIEEKEESGVRPVGLSNIKNNCHESAAIHLTAIERGYNEVTNTQLWEHVNNHTGRKDRIQALGSAGAPEP